MAVPHTIETLSQDYDEMLGEADRFGDICAAKIVVMDTDILLVSVYISPGCSRNNIEFFLTRKLFCYAKENMPMVVTGDFNIDVSKPENSAFLDFMEKFLKLKLVNDRNESTTLGGSCIDLTFSKNMSVVCRRYSSYFSYHRPILSVLAIEAPEPSNI